MYRKSVLPNGITIVTESIPYFPAVSIGFWWKTGGRLENAVNSGISHFIEHMLFKGTSRRNAYEIAREIDAVGGMINAFTGKEYTCLYVRTLRKDLDLALDILADMYLNPLFDEEEMEREKCVIIQEIKMVEDNPEDYIYDVFNSAYFRDDPLGMPILGTVENVERFDKDLVTRHFTDNYGPQGLIITATGRVDHDSFVRRVEELLPRGRRGNGPVTEYHTMEPRSAVTVVEKELEHVYLCIGTGGVSQVDRKRYDLYVINALMGGSMSSHLFQEVRENRGLVYNIYSYVNCYHDVGTFGISTSTSREAVEEVLGLIKEEIIRIRDKGVTEEELEFSKEHIKGNLLISLESSETRMGRLAKNEIYFGGYIPIKETLREIDRIRKKEVEEIGRQIFLNPRDISLTILGEVDAKKIEKLWKS